MLARILTACVLIPIVVVLVWWGPSLLLAAVAAIVALLALFEFFSLGERVGLGAFKKWTMLCAAGIFYAQYSQGSVERHPFGHGFSIVQVRAVGALSVDAIFLIFIFGAAAIVFSMRRPLHQSLQALAISAAGLVFIALPFSYLVRLDEISQTGRALILFTLVLIWAGDTFAYFTGKSIGRIPMAPAISPKKTWEGAVANVAGSVLVAVGFSFWLQIDVWTLIAIAVSANIAGQMGDLLESTYKRSANVKDSGALLPGHGGMLDRIDSLILASPVVWAAYQWLLTR
ncbi:MAG: phosphatidate cytidylyltransferase [Acidobacteriota bacterium]|nr:phosphatidate cytidylyltransferase [Acidobacteriota bacterium]